MATASSAADRPAALCAPERAEVACRGAGWPPPGRPRTLPPPPHRHPRRQATSRRPAGRRPHRPPQVARRRRSLRGGRCSSTSRVASASSPMPAEKVKRRPFTEPRPNGRQRRSAIAAASTAAADQRARGQPGGRRANTEVAPVPGSRPPAAGRDAVCHLVGGAVAAHADHSVGTRLAASSTACPGRSVEPQSTSQTASSRDLTWSIQLTGCVGGAGVCDQRTRMQATISAVTGSHPAHLTASRRRARRRWWCWAIWRSTGTRPTASRTAVTWPSATASRWRWCWPPC